MQTGTRALFVEPLDVFYQCFFAQRRISLGWKRERSRLRLECTKWLGSLGAWGTPEARRSATRLAAERITEKSNYVRFKFLRLLCKASSVSSFPSDSFAALSAFCNASDFNASERSFSCPKLSRSNVAGDAANTFVVSEDPGGRRKTEGAWRSFSTRVLRSVNTLILSSRACISADFTAVVVVSIRQIGCEDCLGGGCDWPRLEHSPTDNTTPRVKGV